VLIVTESGNMTAEIYITKAPITGKNFLKYVDHQLYDGTSFFRTVTLANQPQSPVKIEVIQAGFITGKEIFAPIAHETTAKTGIKHSHGTISMARAKPGTATSSFFICIGDQPELDVGGRRNPDGQGFAAFGKIIQGMDVVRKIHLQPASGQRLSHPVKILSIRRTQ
jgi:peptidyl-prolyl cis-trans isomerase A (cyclophilin A)